jgi:hypothetical protein
MEDKTLRFQLIVDCMLSAATESSCTPPRQHGAGEAPMPTQTPNATTFFRTTWPLLALGFLIAIATLGQTRAADPGWRPGSMS